MYTHLTHTFSEEKTKVIMTIRALTFDTGGTILDWHTGFKTAFKKVGDRYDIHYDWASLSNEYRRRTLQKMLNHGEHTPATKNFDDVHAEVLEELVTELSFDKFTSDDKKSIAWEALHSLDCWPDFPAALTKLKQRYLCVSFTLLSYRAIIDTARKNDLAWDAVISCEGIGKYKVLPDVYLTCADYLQLAPEECCMVASHNFDLDAAKKCGFKTAFIRRPNEWGHEEPPHKTPSSHHDFVADDFNHLVIQLNS